MTSQPTAKTMCPDFGATALDYARHRAGFPDSLFTRLEPLGVGRAGQAVVDLGTGTGTLGRGFARRGCRVIGIDIAEPLLEQARALDAAQGLEVEYRIARAERTGLPGGCAEIVTAGQCWHWFDRAAAGAEVVRILAPQGTVVVAYLDWLPLTGNVVEATESLIERYNAAWKFGGGLGVHPRCLRDLGEAGFRQIESFSYDVAVPYTHEAWRGRIRASAGVGRHATRRRGARVRPGARFSARRSLSASRPADPASCLCRGGTGAEVGLLRSCGLQCSLAAPC